MSEIVIMVLNILAAIYFTVKWSRGLDRQWNPSAEKYVVPRSLPKMRVVIERRK